VKLLRVTGGHFVFHLSAREKRLLFALLDRYPVLDAGYHRASRSDEARLKASEQLLAEAMEEVRARHRKQLELILQDERWLKQTEQGYHCTLSTHQIDWLLQVLNDVRVGSWTRLGCPNEHERRLLDLNRENLRHMVDLELSGYFQTVLLHALEQRSS
jgi:hypothetical protein